MRTPFVQVAVVRLGPNGKVEARYPEVGPYVVAAPGLPYSVVVRLRTALPVTNPFLVMLKVDGNDVGVTYRLRPGQGAGLFKGFMERTDATSTEYRQFVFAKPAEGGHVTAQQGPGSRAGSLEVEVWQGVATGPRDVIQPTVRDVTKHEVKVAALPDGKKFFEAPSLATAVGGVTRGRTLVTTRYTKVGGGPIARVELRYETAATLVLRGVLDPEGDPQHKRIVDKYAFFKAEDVKAEDEGEGPASPSGRQAAASAAPPRPAKRARLAAVPQAGGQQAGGQEAEDDLIEELLQDLKGDPDEEDEPLDPLLQELLCDLTNEDAPEWQARERVLG